MIDLVLYGQGMLNALSVLSNLFIFLFVLAFAGFLIKICTSKKIFKRIGTGMIVFSITTVLLSAVLLLWPRALPKFNLTWDLKSKHTLKELGSPRCAEWKGDTSTWQNCIWQGEGEIRMSFPEERDFSEKCRLVWVNASNGLIEKITVTSEPYTAEGAFKRAAVLFNLWGLDGQELTQWHEKAGAGSSEQYVHYFRDFKEQPQTPQLTLLIKKIENADYARTPWFLSIEFRWYT